MLFGSYYPLLFLLFGSFSSLLEVLTEQNFINGSESFNYKCLDNIAGVNKNQKYHIGLQVTNSVSHQLLTRVFAIFLHDVLHYGDIHLITLNDIDTIAPKTEEWNKFLLTLEMLKIQNFFNDPKNYDMINIKVWTPTPRFGNLPNFICEDCPPITPGRFGWFVPRDFLKGNEKITGPIYDIFMNKSSEDYKRYVINSDILQQLRNGSMEFKNPGCESTDCVTFLAEFKQNTAFIEDEITSLGLFVNVLWLGSNFKTHIDWLYDYYRNNSQYLNRSFVVLHWTPSYAIDTNIKFKQILLPRCEETKVFENSSCKYELTTISKYHFCQKKNSRVISALSKFYIYDKELYELFEQFDSQHKEYKNSISLNEIYNNVACSWMKNNKKTYEEWKPTLTKTKISIGGIYPITDASRGHQNLSSAVERAILAINKNNAILPNHNLTHFKTDGKCKADTVMKAVIHYFNTNENMLGILGPACSETVEPIAGVSRHMKMPLISYSAEGASFKDRHTYPYFFRTIGSNRQYEEVFVSLMQKFGWKRVAAITEDGQKHTEYISHMEELMKNKKLQLILNKKLSSDVTATEINKHLRELKEKRAKIIIADIHYKMAEVTFCEAYKLEMTAYNGYVWFLPIWLAKNWNFTNSNKTCSNEELQNFFQGHLSIMHKPYGNGESKMQENITIEDWLSNYKKNEENISDYTGFVYDAVWVYAIAADKLFRENEEAINSLRTEPVVKRFTELIWQTDFEGLSGRVRFGQGGSRITDLIILQWINNQFIEVGKYLPNIAGNGTNIYPKNGELILTKIKWLSDQHPPEDGTYDCNFSALAKLLAIDCDHSTLSFSIILCFIGVLIVSIVSFLFWKKRYDNKLKKSAKIMKNFGMELLSPAQHNFKTLDKWEISKNKIIRNRCLGEGAFGTVFDGAVMLKPGEWTAVAIKTLKKNTTLEDRLDFLSEAEAMKSFDHKNIVKLLGVCLLSGPLYTIMEFMLYGDLKTYLLARRYLVKKNVSDDSDVSSKHLTMYAMDIARGLSYLEKQKYVHRDIACRNCLVDANRVVKIGDFGMARPIYQRGYYVLHRKGMLPVRWMAPESLFQGKFTPASDIWAFGVAIYEIITFGSMPYPELTDDHLVVENIKSGKTIKIPSDAKMQLGSLMKACWNEDPAKRPTALDMLETFLNHPRLLIPCLENPAFSVTISEEDADDNELIPIQRECFHLPLNHNFNKITENEVASNENTNSKSKQSNKSHENLYVEAEPVTPNGYSIMSPLLNTNINENSNSSHARLLK